MTTANFTKPVTSDLRADVLTYIRDYMAAQAKMFDGDTLTSAPVGTIRYSAANSRFEKWNGTAWAALSQGYLPLAGGTMTGTLTGAGATFTSLSVGGNAVWHAGNLTPSNYLPLAGGTMSGTLNSLNIAPTTNNTRTIGTDALRYAGVYATNFYEAGTALSSKYALAGHTHSYLPLSGGTLTGGLTGTSGAFSSLTVGGTAVSVAGHAHAGSDISSGTVADARLSSNIAKLNATANFTGALQKGGKDVGFLDLPIATALERGKIYPISAGITINTGTAEYTYGVYNDSAAAVTLTQGTGVTLRKSGTATTGNLSLSARGFATVWYRSSTEVVVGGNLA